MGCLDDVVQVLNEIKGVLNNGFSAFSGMGNCGSNGAGLFEATPSSFTDTGDNYPSGYASSSEYKLAKCNLAELWRRNVITSFQSVREINAISLALSALAGVVAIVVLFPISGVILAAMAGALFELAAGGLTVYIAAIDEIIDYFRDELDICVVYEASTVDQAKANLHSDIDSFNWSNPLSASIAKYLVTFDTLNPIWEDRPEEINLDALPQGDCSECGDEECSWVINSGTGPDWPGTSGQFTSTTSDGQPSNNANIYVTLNCGEAREIVVSAISNFQQGGAVHFFQSPNYPGGVQINSLPFQDSVPGTGQFAIIQGFTTPGTFNATIEDTGPA